MNRRLALLVVLGSLSLWPAAAQTHATADGKWKTDVLAWRVQRAKNLQAPDGWLSLVGLDWLQPGDNTFGSASDNAIILRENVAPHLGVLRLGPNDAGVELLPPSGGYPAGLLVDGHSPAAPQKIVTDAAGAPSKITVGTISVTLIRRGDRTAARTRDSRAATLAAFHELRWYEPNATFRIKAKWIPYQPVRQLSVPTIIDTTERMVAPGAAEFTLDGKTLRLEPVLEAPDEKELFFIFRDTTSKTTTYQAARFLYTEFPSHGLAQPGILMLDFNRAYNPPCAFTKFATCPLPPKGNILPVAITAGEKRYHE